MTFATIIRTASGEDGFSPPGPADFNLPPVIWEIDKPMILVTLSVILVGGFFYLASRNATVVPGRLQFAGEAAYGLVRNSIARENIGSEHFLKYVPYLLALFYFILVNNYFGLIPFLQFPTFSHIGYAVALAALSWLLYNGAGIAKHGFFGYLKLQTVPSGVNGPVLALIIPLEFMSNILVRPVTLALRLFANMFAGHLLLMLFSIGGFYLILETDSIVNTVAGLLSFVLFAGITLLELLVMFLQAYVFTLLTAMYISSAIADEH